MVSRGLAHTPWGEDKKLEGTWVLDDAVGLLK